NRSAEDAAGERAGARRALSGAGVGPRAGLRIAGGDGDLGNEAPARPAALGSHQSAGREPQSRHGALGGLHAPARRALPAVPGGGLGRRPLAAGRLRGPGRGDPAVRGAVAAPGGSEFQRGTGGGNRRVAWSGPYVSSSSSSSSSSSVRR